MVTCLWNSIQRFKFCLLLSSSIFLFSIAATAAPLCSTFFPESERHYATFDPSDFSQVGELKNGHGTVNLRSKIDGRVQLMFEVQEGVLTLAVRSGKQSQVRYRGYELFDYMMEYLRSHGAQVQILRAKWNETKTMNTNFDQFFKMKELGFTDEQAAWQTWTGKQAKRHGFSSISSIKISGHRDYGEVIVDFAR